MESSRIRERESVRRNFRLEATNIFERQVETMNDGLNVKRDITVLSTYRWLENKKEDRETMLLFVGKKIIIILNLTDLN